MAQRTFSFTQLNTFSTCGYLWYDRYLLKNKHPTTAAMERGNRLHKEFENVFNGTEPMTPQVKPYRVAVDKLAVGREIITEMPMAMTPEGKPCTIKGNHQKFFLGYADLVLMPTEYRPNGLAYYIDWKTGKSGWEKPLQLDWMAVLIRKFGGAKVKRVATRLAYTTETTFWPQNEWRILGPEELDEAERELFRQGHEIEAAERDWLKVPPLDRSPARAQSFWGQKRSGLCKVCAVRTCEFAGGVK